MQNLFLSERYLYGLFSLLLFVIQIVKIEIIQIIRSAETIYRIGNSDDAGDYTENGKNPKRYLPRATNLILITLTTIVHKNPSFFVSLSKL